MEVGQNTGSIRTGLMLSHRIVGATLAQHPKVMVRHRVNACFR